MFKHILPAVLIICMFYSGKVFPQYILEPAFPNLQDFAYPVEIAHPDDGSNRLFVVQQKGKIYVFNNQTYVSSKKIFIDLTSKVSQTPVTGLFGLAFHPDYKNNRYFYVHHVFDSAGSPTGRWLRVSRYTASSSNPDTALISTELKMIKFPLPGSFHNGGKLAFGPDGYLYISFGDGYSGGAPAQDKSSLLGKILRIDVNNFSGGRNYSIPVTNPFYGNSSGYREEIFAYGMRNTWKFSIDYPTNRIWAGDVGEYNFEEINIIESGKNYGWNKMEGFSCNGTCDTTGKGFTRPIWAYSHDTGQAIIGGFVYRGSLHPELFGKYIYGDEVDSKIWALSYDGINPPENTLLLDTTYNPFDIVSFGLDSNNEIYVLTYNSVSGKIYKLVNLKYVVLKLTAVIEGFYNQAEDKLSMRDTVNVYQRNSESPYEVLDSFKTVIDSVNFSSLCFFDDAPSGKYYLVIRHRNTLETWSRVGGDSLLKGNFLNYDFSDDSSKVFGNNQIKIGSRYCLYSGDVNQDGLIDGSDISITENDVLLENSGYLPTDVTGDNYTDASDLSLIDNNSSKLIIAIKP